MIVYFYALLSAFYMKHADRLADVWQLEYKKYLLAQHLSNLLRLQRARTYKR